MSLHKFAEQVAANGRGEDSLLVHMTPDEVQRLQKFAEANGRSLTINPETGLPEAGMLSDLFKAVAPIALGAFLGPGAFGIAGMGLSAGTAGLITGGLTTLATGSLSRGLMAGLGAYGGAGMAEGLATTGANAMTTAGVGDYASSLAERGIYPTLEGGAVNPAFGEEASKLALEAKKQAFAAPMTERLSAGIDVAKADPLAFAKQNLGSISAAAAPIMAGMMVPTTTPMPTGTNTPMNIKQQYWDGRQLRSAGPVDASKWGNRSFSDIYRGYKNGGGIVALAEGGAVQHFDIGGEAKAALEQAYRDNNIEAINEIARNNQITAEDVGNTWKGFDTSGIQGLQLYTPPAVDTSGNGGGVSNLPVGAVDTGGGGMPVGIVDNTGIRSLTAGDQTSPPQFTQYTDQQISDWFTKNKDATDAQVQQAIIDSKIDPNAVNKYIASLSTPFKDSTWDKGGSGTLGIYNDMIARGISPDEAYAAFVANDPKYGGWSKEKIAKGYNLDKGAYELANSLKGTTADPKFGYDKQWVKFMDDNGYSIDDAAQAFGLSLKDVTKRYYDVKNAEKKIETKIIDNTKVTGSNTGSVVPGGTLMPGGFVYDNGAISNYGNNTGNPLTRTPGDLINNPNGTVTVVPNIPGRPYGGFPGSAAVTDSWVAGGGSPGFTAKAPTTVDEFNTMFNKQTGDSMAAYKYLMGQGANPTKSGVGEISKPYDEAAMGFPTRTNKAYNWDPVSRKMLRNPDYVAPGRDSSGNVTYGMSLNDIKKSLADAPLQGQALYDWAKTNNLSAEDIADALGVPLSSIYAQFRTGSQAAAKKAADDKAASDAANTSTESSSGTGGQAAGGLQGYAMGGYALGGLGSLGGFSDGGRLLKGPGDGVSDSIPATIGAKQQPARLADGEFVVPARIVSELGNGSTEAGARKLYAMMDRVQKARGKTTGKGRVAANTNADKHLPV